MAKFNVHYTETYEGYFEVEANNEDEIYDRFSELIESGEIRLDKLWCSDSNIDCELIDSNDNSSNSSNPDNHSNSCDPDNHSDSCDIQSTINNH